MAWDQQVADWTKGWRYSGGPIVANGVIVQGMTGCGNAQPGGCFITGHDVKTGAELWRVQHHRPPGDAGRRQLERHSARKPLRRFGLDRRQLRSRPERGVLRRRPALSVDRRDDRAAAEEAGRQVNNALYTNSTLAIDAKTGEVKWYHQYLQTDTWDLDYAYERMLIDLPVNGVTRKAVVTTGKLGIIEAIDRTTGEWLWAQGDGAAERRARDRPRRPARRRSIRGSMPHIGETTFNCPADPGGRGWPATAYSPKTQASCICR